MYAELHCHSNYSFQEGASSVEDLLVRACDLGYRALALTDHDNLCGAMHFAQVAKTLDIQAITGAELTIKDGENGKDGSHLTFLAESQEGYSQLSNLISYSYIAGDRRNPALDLKYLPDRVNGLLLLTGCRSGRVPSLLTEGRYVEAETQLRQYLDCFGTDNVFVELQQNLVQGDVQRNRRLIDLARKLGVGTVATNNVHYHVPERHRLQDALVSIKHNRSLEETHKERRANNQFYLKSTEEMAALFAKCPEAIKNTLRIAERCSFDLTKDLAYRFPDYPVPEGATAQSHLEDLCRQAAERRYGGMNQKVQDRLQEELRLIGKHNLAGFFLIYYEIIQMARQIMIEMGLSDAEIPLEERPPGRGRGSSVAMMVGYLIGLSHIDPLKYNLSLDRFLSDDLGSVPDIDLDFPRNIREELIIRVHQKWGWDRAVLTGMISTYQMRGAVRDLGKALGLPAQGVDKLAKRVDSHDAKELELEMLQLPEYQDKVDAPGWRDLIDLAAQLDGFPKYLAQHPGGMIISSSPLIDIVPVQQAAIADRYICHWDKDSIDQAGFVKIDFLALGALSQMQDCLLLIEERGGKYIDLSRIDCDDQAVYKTIHLADTIGIFQVESAAQMQTTPRLKPSNLTEMAYEVGAVRPGVGVNDGVSQFIQRYSQGTPWEYDHPLEKRALERTWGIILFQDQVNHVAMDLAGFTSLEADQMRRAFGRRNNEALISHYWEKFRDGAAGLGVPEDAAQRIFKKFNGHYMFPESHAFAFGATAYHMAWLKYYYPLEFYVAIFNQQPMGFYNTETLKEDAKRHGITILNPDINHSRERCTIKDECLLLGLRYVRGMGDSAASQAVAARDSGGSFKNLADAMERTGLQREAIENLVTAGAFDSLTAASGNTGKTGRRQTLWEVGLRYRPINTQQPLLLPVEQDMAELPEQSQWETMGEEYRIMGLYPEGHLMALARPHLRPGIISSREVEDKADGDIVTVAGLVIRRQRPLAKAVFLTLEDEFGHIPLVVWPGEFAKYRQVIREPLLVIRGQVSRRDGTMNIVTQHVEPMPSMENLPKSKNWQ
ncbi:MAG: DNA polymerase III subunit alpha [Chloroflexi bacterium]|nr:DNA polymerase III subunit alpha [Chloroflexota bacterium]